MSQQAPAVAGLRFICIDAQAPAELARFWGDLLGGVVTIDDDGDATVAVPGSLRLDLLHVADPTPGKNRLHLDLATTDLALAVAQAVALGAARADDVYSGGRWVVLRDPEGNEFCLLPPELG